MRTLATRLVVRVRDELERLRERGLRRSAPSEKRLALRRCVVQGLFDQTAYDLPRRLAGRALRVVVGHGGCGLRAPSRITAHARTMRCMVDPEGPDFDIDDPEELFGRLYESLRSLAGRELGRERPDHTLQPTALVHEAWMRLFAPDGSTPSFADR
ncbi:MAG: ECF-type sigma factor, partial [Planctomycetota bacterium]